jgi:hypothetical protein
MTKAAIERWAIIDLFGHTRLAGRVSEVQQFGTSMCRIEVPEVDGRPGFTRDVGGTAIFGMTDVSEDLAVAFTRQQRTAPVQAYELKMLPAAAEPPDADLVEEDDHADDVDGEEPGA